MGTSIQMVRTAADPRPIGFLGRLEAIRTPTIGKRGGRAVGVQRNAYAPGAPANGKLYG
jgi:hypothetical protein